MAEKISIIIPCRNEGAFIGKCLDSILENSYPQDSIEILAIDGMSEDKTRTIIEEYARKYPAIRLLYNTRKIVSTAMNIGIKNSTGKIIIRMDAHNIYEKDYISKCVKYLQEYKADNVGGVWITIPGGNDILSHAIAMGLSSRFGVGNAHFRVGVKEPRFVDTVPFGCYRRDVFDKVGLFDEELVRNQDDEFNARLIKRGGKILLHPDIKSYYHARTSLGKLWRMYFQYGYFKPLAAQKIGSILTYRQLVPCIFVATLAASGIISFLVRPLSLLFISTLLLYMLVNLVFTFVIAAKRGFAYLLVLPVVFMTLHFSYGLGSLKGIVHFILFKKTRSRADIPLTR